MALCAQKGCGHGVAGREREKGPEFPQIVQGYHFEANDPMHCRAREFKLSLLYNTKLPNHHQTLNRRPLHI
jgi:hypothetical protein